MNYIAMPILLWSPFLGCASACVLSGSATAFVVFSEAVVTPEGLVKGEICLLA